MAFAVLFPGQGSQFVGMGAELFEARPELLGEAADRVLGWSLGDLCLRGPEEELTKTQHAQPALFAVAYALWVELARRLPTPPAAAAGHSLGEYTALAAAGVLDYETALRTVAARGRAMAAAAALEPSAMAAVLGAELELVEEIAADRRAQGGRLFVANVNAPGQIVVAGGEADIAWLEETGRGLGLRRTVRLKVAGGFHSPFMEPAAAAIAEALGDLAPAAGAFPVYSNVTARPIPPDEIGRLLAVQVVSPVRFADGLQAMADAGVDTFVHVGPGDVTAGMARRAVPGSTVAVVDSLAGIEPAVQTVAERSGVGGER